MWAASVPADVSADAGLPADVTALSTHLRLYSPAQSTGQAHHYQLDNC